jgi:hypothetical protein
MYPQRTRHRGGGFFSTSCGILVERSIFDGGFYNFGDYHVNVKCETGSKCLKTSDGKPLKCVIYDLLTEK